MGSYEEIEPFVKGYENAIEVSAQTPLLSNLDMCENIALIEEVHLKSSRTKAIEKAKRKLEALQIESIYNKRIYQCTAIEVFYVMVIRATMCEVKNILIITPFNFINGLNTFELVFEQLSIIQGKKNIIIIDIEKNFYHYRDCQCTIIR